MFRECNNIFNPSLEGFMSKRGWILAKHMIIVLELDVVECQQKFLIFGTSSGQNFIKVHKK